MLLESANIKALSVYKQIYSLNLIDKLFRQTRRLRATGEELIVIINGTLNTIQCLIANQ